MESSGVIIDGSRSARKSIQIDTVKFFVSVGKFASKIASGSIADAASEIPDVVAAVGSSTPEDRSCILVIGALRRALAELISPLMPEDENGSTKAYEASFIGLSDKFTLIIDRDFFLNPALSRALASLTVEAEGWLRAISINEADINNVVGRLNTVIARALHDEWRSKPKYYESIKDASMSPFVEAANIEQEWVRYRSYLVSLQGDQVFDESFSLAQVYIEPRCYFSSLKARLADGTNFVNPGASDLEPQFVVRELTGEIDKWLRSVDREFSCRVIAGGPGAGKSSYAKLLASRLANNGEYVLFVPLHLIDLELGISSAIAEYFKDTGFFASSPIDACPTGASILLVLDGLDEIQMQGRAAQEAAYNMVNDLLRWIDRLNSVNARLKCLVTGRELAVQSSEGLFKAEGQILHLLPYYVPQDQRLRYCDDYRLLQVDQRDAWWQNYGRLKGIEYNGMPDILTKGEIGDVTAQPLLNYLVALAYGRGLSFQDGANINQVYEDLLRAVHDRSWAAHTHPSVRNVPYDSFVRLLEEVSLAVWHGAGRTTTLVEVEEHCKQSKVASLLSSLEESSSAGLSSLLLAFYFRQKGLRNSGEKTFEFTHKTFAEYLICLGIVRLIETLDRQLRDFLHDSDTGADEETALYKWLVVCGRTSLDKYLVDFIRRQVRLKGIDSCRLWQNSIAKMFSFAQRVGWPVHRLEGVKFLEQVKRIRNAEEALLACLDACARVTEEQSDIMWPSESSFGSILRKLQGQRVGPPNVLAMSCLSYLRVDRQCLDMIDLYSADLHCTSFVGAALNYSTLFLANLTDCDFTKAAMDGCNLSSASLKGSKIPITQLTTLKVHKATRGMIDEDFRRAKKIELNTFLRAVRRMHARGAQIVNDNGDELDEKMAAEYYRNKGAELLTLDG